MTFVSDCIGQPVERVVEGMNAGDVVLLENVRFYPEEEKNDPEFAKKLAAFGDVYVNDAFGSAHRAHASTEGVAHLLPGVAGFLMEKELNYLGTALANPATPVRRDPRRRQGERQDQGDRKPFAQSRFAAHRRRDGEHVPRRARG